MPSKPATIALALAALAVSGIGGFLAAKSSPRSAPETAGGTEAGKGESTSVPSEGESGGPTAAERKASLMTLLETARRELLGGTADNGGTIRAAARLSLIDPADLPAALEMLSEFDGGLYRHGDLAALLLEQWAAHDGAAACDFAVKHMDPPMMGLHPVGDPLRAWASLDPKAAMAWFQQRKTGEGVVKGAETSFGEWLPISDIRWIMGAWAMNDAEAAANAYIELDTKEERSGALTGMMEAAASSPDRFALLDAIAGEGDKRNDRLWRVLDEWSGHDPAELAAWIDTQEIKKSNFYMNSKAVLGSWLLDDRDAAIEWWMNNEGGHTKTSSKLGRLIDSWVEVDVIGASEWLAEQDLTEDYVSAVRSLSNRLTREHPENAFVWAQAVPADWARENALKTAYKAWFKKDADAARAALDATELSDEARAEIEQSTDAKPESPGNVRRL